MMYSQQLPNLVSELKRQSIKDFTDKTNAASKNRRLRSQENIVKPDIKPSSCNVSKK